MIELEKNDLAVQTYSLWKKTPSRKNKRNFTKAGSTAFQKGNARDPIRVTSVMEELNHSWGWQQEIENAQIIFEWEKIVGQKIAERTSIKGISNGIITVECSSTSWATELRRIRAEIITKMGRQYPNSNIREIKFIVTGVPTWNHGFRSVRGRGPRDTYK